MQRSIWPRSAHLPHVGRAWSHLCFRFLHGSQDCNLPLRLFWEVMLAACAMADSRGSAAFIVSMSSTSERRTQLLMNPYPKTQPTSKNEFWIVSASICAHLAAWLRAVDLDWLRLGAFSSQADRNMAALQKPPSRALEVRVGCACTWTSSGYGNATGYNVFEC